MSEAAAPAATGGSLNVSDAAPLLPKASTPAAAELGYTPIGPHPKRSTTSKLIWVYVCLAVAIALILATLILNAITRGDVIVVNSEMYKGPIPYKFSVDNIPPHTFQRDRGTWSACCR